jgi:pimeloyl-ACP methyl ester carboxylesterase
LWKDHGAAHVKYLFRLLRLVTTRTPVLIRSMLRHPLLREVLLAVPLSVGSRRMPTADALRVVDDLAGSRAFEATFDSSSPPFSARDIAVPLTVAFGDRDWILPKASRSRDALPAHTRWIGKAGWGHVPMWVDPVGVAQLILEGTR